MSKKIKTALAAILAACSLLNLTGCSEKNANAGGNSGTAPGDGNSGLILDDGGAVKLQYSPIMLTDNNTLNSIRLFDAIIADKENAMFSPLSLNMALGLIEAGANGETKAALDSYLQTENFTDFAEKYMKLARERYSSESQYGDWKNVLEIANSIWADERIPLKDGYKKAMTERLDAEVQNVRFADLEKTLDKINGWVNEKTHEMIPKILSKDNCSEDTAAVLVNTVYFESAWKNKWWINEDKPEPFTLPDGTTKELSLMNNGGDSYFENDKATAFGCSYMNGLEFIGILPKNEGEFTLEGLDIPALIESRSYNYDVLAYMPKLDFDTDLDLTEPLKAAGLENIFSDAADFSGMSDVALCVSFVLQNTKLELDENGTKAAAATAIGMVECAAPEPKENKTVRLDRPFAFMIYDSAEDQILFLGKVTNP